MGDFMASFYPRMAESGNKNAEEHPGLGSWRTKRTRGAAAGSGAGGVLEGFFPGGAGVEKIFLLKGGPIG